jgi:peptidoglycan/xylan/chitin deacetylase (PgdA/CDA1 family)
MDLRWPMSMWKVPRWPADVGAAPDIIDAGDGRGLPLILLYHSIEKVQTDPWGVRVRPRNFAEHMAVLRAHCFPMSLADLHAALDAGSVPDRAVVVTFDDGYVDNLIHAKPAMEKHRVPGTVFVSSGYVGQMREYWWDELDRLLLHAGRLPQHVRLNIAGEECEWDLDGAANLGALRAWRARHWFAWNDPPTPRHRAFLEIWSKLRAAPAVEARERALEQLRQQAGAVAAGARPTHRCCTIDQLRELAGGTVGQASLPARGNGAAGLIEIGAHTVLHPSLGHIDVQAQRHEIFQSKATLEDLLQMPVTSFSYPFGTRDDYSADTISLLREAGFARSCSNFPEPLQPATDRFQFPRRVVMDWNGAEFVQRLAKWFGER